MDVDGGDSVGSPYEEKYVYKWSRPFVRITGVMAESAVIKSDPIVLNQSRVKVRLEKTISPPYVYKSHDP